MNKKIKNTIITLVPLAALLLELLPFGAVLNFAADNYAETGEYVRTLYSFFNLIPFGYANVGPFITAILTCIAIPIAVLRHFTKKAIAEKLLRILSVLCIFTSMLPLIMFGGRYITLTSLTITALFTLSLILLSMEEKS